MSIQLIFSLLLFQLIVADAKFPTEFKKCSRHNSDFKKCILEAAQHGISQLTKSFPEYKIPTIDPLDIAELKIAPGPKGVVAVEQKFKNCKLFGISKIKFLAFEIDLEKREVYGKGKVSDLKFKCDYELDGKILILPIVGKGRSTVDLENTLFDTSMFWRESKRKDGQTTLTILQNVTLNAEPERIRFEFENLFNGDKVLGDNINKILNENWRDVWIDVRGGYEKAISLLYVEMTNDFFTCISMEDAFD